MKKKILVVEDINAIRKKLISCIADDNENYDVSEAENGFAALNLLRDDYFDLIVSDVEMPKMDGLSLLKIVKQTEKATSVIMLTTLQDEKTINKVFQLGGDDYIVKNDIEKQIPLLRAKIKKALADAEVKLLIQELEMRNEQVLIQRGELLNYHYQLSKDRTTNPFANYHVLVLEEKRGLRKSIVRTLSTTGSHLYTAASKEELGEIIARTPVNVCIINSENLSSLKYIKEKLPSAKVMILTKGRIEGIFEQITPYAHINNIVSLSSDSNYFSFNSEMLNTYYKMINNSDIFGLEKYIRCFFPPIQKKVYDTFKREEQITEITDYIKQLGVRKRFINAAAEVLDEFLMNAMYDAPVDQNGKSKYHFNKRTEQLILEENEAPSVSYLCDGETLGVAVSDPFGAITRDKIVNYLAKCFRKDKNQIDKKKGGAGLGLYKIFNAVNCMVVNLEPGKRTEFIAIFDLNVKTQSRRGSFHFFQT